MRCCGCGCTEPDCLNALDEPTLNEIIDLFGSLRGDDEIRVVVLGGSGRVFSAGADRKAFPGRTPRRSRLSVRRWRAETGLRTIRAITDADVVTIARTHGYVVGGAMLLAAACDFRVGAEDSEFWVPEIELGMSMSWGGTPLLIKEIGMARARELIMTCRHVKAQEAVRIGLLHTAVPADELDTEVNSWVDRILGLPDAAVDSTKQQFRRYSLAGRIADLTETDAEIYNSVIDRDA